jgi:hypothetical protein
MIIMTGEVEFDPHYFAYLCSAPSNVRATVPGAILVFKTLHKVKNSSEWSKTGKTTAPLPGSMSKGKDCHNNEEATAAHHD